MREREIVMLAVKQVVQNAPEQVHRTFQLVMREAEKKSLCFHQRILLLLPFRLPHCVVLVVMFPHFSIFLYGCHYIPFSSFILSSFLFLVDQLMACMYFSTFFLQQTLMIFALLYENSADSCFTPTRQGVPLPTVPPEELWAIAHWPQQLPGESTYRLS